MIARFLHFCLLEEDFRPEPVVPAVRQPRTLYDIDAKPAPCSPYASRSGAPQGVKRETGASQALQQGRTMPVLPPQR
ncbi:conserved protein of unknown function [Pseudomonas putida KT2440]|uniref:Uncharacterized protein n=1 Tax=Pseudomonas putida (strain ATCC 47054 / DSM 6125 / CFBP 8728 / NCIMB 11950 / KT2440) TaxID=160488 RepID=Q88HF2_PSEPK|nr:conserved protein of unknown function [Pseudomonas putida KT2440]